MVQINVKNNFQNKPCQCNDVFTGRETSLNEEINKIEVSNFGYDYGDYYDHGYDSLRLSFLRTIGNNVRVETPFHSD